jgi:hypothetical protein
VGNAAFASKLAADTALVNRAYRLVNSEDLVTRVAPRAMGYEHVGGFAYLDDKGQLSLDMSPWLRFLNTVIDAMNDFQKAARGGIKDHSMELYVRKLDNLANASA